MANAGSLIATLGPLPTDLKKVLTAYTNEWIKKLRFGAVDSQAVAAENFGGAIVPFTTSDVANGEVAVPHMLARVPRLLIPMLDLGTVNATMPDLTVTRAADATYVYVSSAQTGAAATVYVE